MKCKYKKIFIYVKIKLKLWKDLVKVRHQNLLRNE